MRSLSSIRTQGKGKEVQRFATTHLSHSGKNICIWRILCWKGIAAVRREILPWNILSQNVVYCCLCPNCFLGSLITSWSFAFSCFDYISH